MARYSISQAGKELGISPETLRRWERLGKTPRIRRLARTGERIYTEQDLAAIREWMNRLEDPPENRLQYPPENGHTR